MSMYDKNHYNIVISLQLIKIKGKKNLFPSLPGRILRINVIKMLSPCFTPDCRYSNASSSFLCLVCHYTQMQHKAVFSLLHSQLLDQVNLPTWHWAASWTQDSSCPSPSVDTVPAVSELTEMRSTSAQWFRAQTTEALAPAVTNWVTLGKLLNLSAPQVRPSYKWKWYLKVSLSIK